MSHRHLRSLRSLLPWCLGLILSPAWGMTISPGLFLLQGIPPGQPVDLAAVAGFHFVVPNTEPKETTYNVISAKPIEGGILQWEAGYEEIPDPSWCRLEPRVFTIAPQKQAEIGLTIDIPDRPEFYNRRFVVAIVLAEGADPGIGVGLALAARIMIETIPDPTKGGNALATIPAIVNVRGTPGQTVLATTRIVNRTGADRVLHPHRLSEIVRDPLRRPRYASTGFEFLAETSWLTPGFTAMTLPADYSAPWTAALTIPADAVPGKDYEELAFLVEDPASKDERVTSGTVVTFVRVQVHVEAVAPVPAQPVVEPTPFPPAPATAP